MLSDLIDQVPQLLEYLPSDSLALVLGTSSALRQRIHNYATKIVSCTSDQDIAVLAKCPWPQVTHLSLIRATHLRHLWLRHGNNCFYKPLRQATTRSACWSLHLCHLFFQCTPVETGMRNKLQYQARQACPLREQYNTANGVHIAEQHSPQVHCRLHKVHLAVATAGGSPNV